MASGVSSSIGVPSRTGSTKPLQLLQILGNAILGGMETYVSNLITRLPSDEFQVTCLCPYESAFTASLRRLGVKVYVAPIQDDPVWRSVELAVELIRQHRIDVIHAHLLNAHTLAGIAGRLTNTPAVSTIHGRSLWTQEISVSRLTGTNLIVVCQDAHAQALAAGIPADAVTLIPNGVDTQRFTPQRSGAAFRRALGVPLEATLVGFVGRLAVEKGPDKFVQAADRIHRQLPDVHFVLVGEGALGNQLREMISQMGLTDRVHLAGTHHNTESVYPAFDLLLQTSRSEAMPLVLLEGMACGCPIIALGVGGVAELIESGTNGILISPGAWSYIASSYPGDWEGVAAAVIDLLGQPARLKQMGQAGRQRAEQVFDIRHTVRETAAVFQRLVRPPVMRKGGWQPTVVRDQSEVERRAKLRPRT
jgi:glycosyltransferase involved in cell wall biosynthesis